MSEDRWAGLDAFMAVAELGSFTAGAGRVGQSISHVSREVGRLEARVGKRLFTRTTRRVTLTAEGLLMQARGRQLIDAREDAFDAVAGSTEALEGNIRLTCPVAYGETEVVPAINEFLVLHPKVTVEIELTNAVIDIIAQGFDLAIRIGNMGDARLRAERLGSRGLHLCASPAYWARAGVPEAIGDLRRHRCLIGSAERWHFSVNGRDVQMTPRTGYRCNSGFAVVDAALKGVGVCQLPDFYVADHLAIGALVEVLTAERIRDQGIWAVCQDRDHIPRRLLALIEHIRARVGQAQPVAAAAAVEPAAASSEEQDRTQGHGV
jgi:DNA-binding transcriptional LysR family regulator